MITRAGEGDPADGFIAHHLLSDGVLYRQRTDQFAWHPGLDGYLLVEGHEDETLYFGIAVDEHDRGLNPNTYREFGLALVNELLTRMNWISAGAGPSPEPSLSLADEASAPLGQSDGPAESAGPDYPFSWGEDLTQWVTEDEIAEIVTDLLRTYADTDLEGAVHTDPSDDGESWDWSVGAVGEIRGPWILNAHNGDHDGRYDGRPTDVDSRLPDGVGFEAEVGFGFGHYIFSGPSSDELISLWLRPAGTSFGYPPSSQVDAYEDMLFSLASRLLRELGWAD